ncbi:MAG: phosphotransferase family protein [Acidimicrobiia bacterium]
MSDGLVDVEALTEWVGDGLPGAGTPFTAERMGQEQGIANALFALHRAGERWVLRRPPAVKNHPTASNIAREWRVLQALGGTDVPHARALLFCEDTEVIGAPFMISEFVDGFTPIGLLPPPFDAGGAVVRDLSFAYVDALVALGAVDWRSRGLEGFGKPDGFLERQVSRWRTQLDGYRVREFPDEELVCEWLESNRPESGAPAILHGDYSQTNVMVAPDLPPRVAAIVDWDTCTIGDPLLDIGHLLSRWSDPSRPGFVAQAPRDVSGFPTHDELAAHYAERSGRDLSALAYYECLTDFKLAVIVEGTYARQFHAGVPDSQNTMAEIPLRLFRHAADIARGERG